MGGMQVLAPRRRSRVPGASFWLVLGGYFLIGIPGSWSRGWASVAVLVGISTAFIVIGVFVLVAPLLIVAAGVLSFRRTSGRVRSVPLSSVAGLTAPSEPGWQSPAYSFILDVDGGMVARLKVPAWGEGRLRSFADDAGLARLPRYSIPAVAEHSVKRLTYLRLLGLVIATLLLWWAISEMREERVATLFGVPAEAILFGSVFLLFMLDLVLRMAMDRRALPRSELVDRTWWRTT